MKALPVQFNLIPSELLEGRCFVNWKWEQRANGNGELKWTKPPIQPDGNYADSTNPETWHTFDAVRTAYESSTGGDGIGLVLSLENGYTGIDLDHCVDEQSNISPWAQEIIDCFGSYSERTPSGTGIRIFVKGRLPPGRRKKGSIEMYDQGRYLTLTGWHITNTPLSIKRRQAELDQIHSKIFGVTTPQPHIPEKCLVATPNLDDRDLIDKAMCAINGTKFCRLWDGHWQDEYGSQSEADLAMCSHLAFWTGNDPVRIDQLFRQSKLYREKWDEKRGTATYGQMTVDKAMSCMEDFYIEHHTGASELLKREFERTAISLRPTTGSFQLIRLSQLLEEPEETVDWTVDGILPKSGSSVLAAKPKVGKSTFARNLAKSVACGEPFLGRTTIQGPVIYLALEEKRTEVGSHFQDLGAPSDAPIWIFASHAPDDVLKQVRAKAEELKPALIVIDPILKFARTKDINDYAEVTRALEPLHILAREFKTHVMIVHHLGKKDQDGGDAILGSTAIFAAVDTAILLKRSGERSTISSLQRYGESLPETVLSFDLDKRSFTIEGLKDDLDLQRIEKLISDFLKKIGKPALETEIQASVEGRKGLRVRALRNLVSKGLVNKSGKGGKKDPFQYKDSQHTQSSCSPVPTLGAEHQNKNQKSDLTACNLMGSSCSQEIPFFENGGNKNFESGTSKMIADVEAPDLPPDVLGAVDEIYVPKEGEVLDDI